MVEPMQKLEKGRSALLLLDFQNYSVHPDGYWATREPAVLTQLTASRVIGTTERVLTGARAAGLTVIHVGAAWRQGSPDMNVSSPGAASYRDRSIEGTWGADFSEPLRPVPGELVVWKRGISALSGTDLDRLLRLKDINTLALAGVVTNFAIEATAFEAFDRGYRVIVLKDCCTAATDLEHEHSLTYVLPVLATVIAADEFLGWLAE